MSWPANPKGHDVDEITKSIQRFGFVAPGIVNETTGVLVAGHGRARTLKAMHEAGASPPRRIRVTNGRWYLPIIRGIHFNSDAEAEAYALADNRMTELGGWNDSQLAEVLQAASANNGGLEGTGFTAQDLSDLLERISASDEDEDTEISDGSVLALTGVTYGEPRHKVTRGEVWELGYHRLVIADVFTGWREWAHMLDELSTGLGLPVLFCPYPGAYIPIGNRANDGETKLVMVQPDPFIAGHILDQYANVNGEGSVRKLDV